MRKNLFEAFPQSWINQYQDYMPLWVRDGDISPMATARRRKGRTIVGLSILIIVLIPFILLSLGRTGEGIGNAKAELSPSNGPWSKPAGLTVVALVFYGRRANVQILERYLRVQPLVSVLIFPEKFGGEWGSTGSSAFYFSSSTS